MRTGGAERFVSNVLTHLDSNYFDITLILINKEGNYLKLLPKNLNIIDLKCLRVRNSFLKIVYLINYLKPDVVFTTVSHLNIFLGTLRIFFLRKAKFIARESNTLSVRIKNQKYPRLFKILYKLFYNNFDVVIAQSKFMKVDLVDNFGLDSKKIKVIYNPVDINFIHSNITPNKKLFNNKNLNLLAVGSLEYQKGFDILINASKFIKCDFNIIILGRGSLYESLVSLRNKLGLKNNIKFIGNVENPFIYMNEADFLVLSSRFEGLPNVVLEANACGTPVIAFDCPGGTSEIIKDGLNGILIKKLDSNALAQTINTFSQYKFINKEIISNTREKHSIEKIIPIITSLF